MSDPIETQDLETDDEIAAIGLAFQTLAKTMYGEFRARDVVSRILEGKDDEADSDASQLRDALQGAGCHVHESAKASKSDTVGYWLRAQRDKIAGGYKLIRFAKGSVARWQLKYTRRRRGRLSPASRDDRDDFGDFRKSVSRSSEGLHCRDSRDRRHVSGPFHLRWQYKTLPTLPDSEGTIPLIPSIPTYRGNAARLHTSRTRPRGGGKTF